MSSLSYSGITLDYVRTSSIDHEPVYDESGTDYLYSKVTLSIHAVVNASLQPATGGETATQTMARIRHLLSMPRQHLVFNVGADTLFDVSGPDVKNGPQPQRLSITQVGGTQTYLIDYSVTFWVIECPAGGSPPTYISHRWRESVALDECFFSKRTRTGKIVVRADMNTSPESLRGVVAPSLLPGFRRVSSDYTIQEDGLAVQYSFVDQEVYLQPPPPAVKAEGEYIESTANGATRFGEVRVKLYGSKNAPTIPNSGDKGALLQLAILIAMNKLQLAGPATDKVLGSGAIKEDMWNNIIEVRFRTMLKALPARVGDAAMDLTRFTTYPTGSDPQGTPVDPGTRGSAGLVLVAQVLKDPCPTPVGSGTNGYDPGSPTGTGSSTSTFTTTPKLPDDQSGQYDDPDPGMYTDYRINNSYQYDYQKLMLPTAAEDAGPSFVQVAGPTLVRVVDWIAEKVGDKPALPSPFLNDGGNSVLMKASIEPAHIDLMADGETMKFKVCGRYVYGAKAYNPTAISAGLPPWISDNVAPFICFRDEDFADGIIDACELDGGTSEFEEN